jgi:hypothetical protein
VEPAAECVVRLYDEAATDLALEADVHLVTLRDAEGGIEPAREVGLSCGELADERRVSRERFGEA